jgi:hypothetical protein
MVESVFGTVSEELCLEVFRETDEELGMPLPDGIDLAALGKLLVAVLTNGLEEAIAQGPRSGRSLDTSGFATRPANPSSTLARSNASSAQAPSAASSVQPPANTASRSNRSCSVLESSA